MANLPPRHWVIFHDFYPSDTGFCVAATHDGEGRKVMWYRCTLLGDIPTDDAGKRKEFGELFGPTGVMHHESLKLGPDDTIEFFMGEHDDGIGTWHSEVW